MRTVIYKLTSGEILKEMYCSADDITAQAQSGEGVLFIPVNVECQNHYVWQGELIEFPVRPSPYHVLDWVTKQWVAPSDYMSRLSADSAAHIDVLAGQTRLKYITTSPGQEATYTAKLADAKAYIAANYPADATSFVWINTEATATGATPQQVADLIVYTAGLWAQVGAQIEGARQAAKQAINNAGNAADIYTAEQAFKSAMALL